MVPLYEIFIGQSLRFQIRVLAWVLPDNHDIYGQYNSSCENVFLSNLVYSLNPYSVYQGIPDNLSIDYFSIKYLSIDYLALQAKSAAAYNEIHYDEKTGTGFVVLPSQRRLRDYKNYIHPKQDFNYEIISKLKKKIKGFSDITYQLVNVFDTFFINKKCRKFSHEAFKALIICQVYLHC